MIDTTAPTLSTYTGIVGTTRDAVRAYRTNAVAIRRMENGGGCTMATERAIERREKDNQRITLWIEQHDDECGRQAASDLREEDQLRNRVRANRHPRPELAARLGAVVRRVNAYAQGADVRRWLDAEPTDHCHCRIVSPVVCPVHRN